MTPTPPLIRTMERLRGAFWRRRFIGGLVRAAWLALLVPVLVMGVWLWSGQRVPFYNWLALSLALALLALLWAMRPIRLEKMTRRLDHLLHARAQLITAYEVSQSTEAAANPVANQLLQRAVNLAIGARQQISTFSRGFWLEVHALLAITAILIALLLFDAISLTLPQAAPLDLPPAGQEPGAEALPPLDAQLMPPPFQPPPLSPAQVQAALEALADALRDQAISNPVAEAIDRGDLAGAAEAVRRIADQLSELSEEARTDLGEAMNEAAQSMGEVPGFSEPLQAGGSALNGDELGQAAAALDQLAEMLDGLAESMSDGPPQPDPAAPPQPDQPPAEADSGSGAGGAGEADSGGSEPSSPAAESERMLIDGQPLELESDSDMEERVLQPAPLDAAAGDRRTSDAPFARQPLNAPDEELGADPLSYPWEKRDIVRRYFTP